MKKLTLAVTILVLLLGLALGQKKPTIKQVNVTAQTVMRRPAKTGYVLNLTRRGTLYNLAEDVDNSRIQIHSAKGSVTMADLIKSSGQDLHGKAVVGLISDIRAMKIGSGRTGGGLNFTCGAAACVCHGDEDCNHLFSTNSCGPFAVCFISGGSVVCVCATA